MDVVNRATGGLGASHEGVTAESDPEPRVPSEDSPKSSAAAAASESYTHVDTPRENSQCSIPKEAAPFLGDPKEAASAPHLPDTVKLINSPSTELAATKGTTPEPANQEEDGSTLPPKGKSQDSKAAFGIKKDTKATATTTGGKRSIPLKRDRMDPLKLDMTKPTAMPLTSSQQSLQCIECHIIFSDDKSKQRHLKMSHPAEYEQCMLGDSLFACYVCDRHFANSIDLMAHQRTHTEKQPFKCLLCGEAFKRSSELTTHKKVHCSSQGYKCIDCGKLCKTLTLLKYHSRTHTGEKPYVCKECGKRFSMPKALQRHLESHTQDEGDENGDGTNAAAKSKKQKSNAPTERKYSCPQCKAMFKTERTLLHHMKNKHAQNKNVPPSRALVTQHLLNQGPPLLTQAALDQPHVLRFDSGGQAPQCIEPEQIKRLIESLGNVQKVNQLVIYGLEPVSFQSQTMNLQPVPGVMQPIRFDMTQTVPSVEFKLVTEEAKSLDSEHANQQVESTAAELNGGHRDTNDHSSVERTTQSVRQMRDHTGTIDSETLQSRPVELERISFGTEKTATVEEPSSVEETIVRESIPFRDVEEMRCETKTVETIQENGHIQILEFLQQSSTLIPTNELENENGHMVSLQEEVVQMQYMIPSDTLSLGATGGLQQTEEQVVTLTPLETQIVTLTSIDRKEESKKNVGNVSEQDVGLPHLETSDEPKDCIDQTELNKSQFSSEAHFSEDISVHPQPSLHESDTAEVVAGNNEPHSQETTKLAEALKLKKGSRAKKTSKKEKAKRQISDLKQKIEHDVTVHISQQKVLAPHPSSQLMTTATQHSRTKGHILVQFGLGNKKEKVSKTAGASKRSKKRDDGELQEEGESQQKKKGEDRKGKTNTSENKTLTAILNKPQNQEQHVLQKEEAKEAKLKSRKRKFKIHKSTSKSLTEIEVISSPLPKKKKQEKVKKPKPLIKTSKKKVTKKKTLKLKQKEKEETPLAISPDQVKAEAMLLLKGHKQPQLKVHKLDDPKTLSQLELVPACPSTIACNEETNPTPMKETEHHKNKSTKAKKQPRPIQACVESSSPNLKGTSMRKKVKAGRKRKTPKADGEMMPTSPSLTCDCGVKFSEVLALQEHVAAVHSGHTQGCYDYSNGTLSEDHVKTSVSSEVLPNNSSKTLGLPVTADWDAEIEMGELGLGDREDQRVSFPALNPSPSLPHAPTLVEGEYEEVQKDANSVTTEKCLEVVSSGSKRGKQPKMVSCQKDPPVSQTLATCLSTQVTTPEVQNVSAFSPLPGKYQKGKGKEGLLEANEKISEIQADAMKTIHESDKAVEEDVKEELPLDVNLVTVQDENQPISSQDDDTPESSQNDCQMASEIQVMSSHENVHESNLECLSHTMNLKPVVDLNSTVTTAIKDSSSNIPEIKQEDVEMTVHTEERKSGPNRNNMTRGRKRGAGRGRRGTSKKRNMGSRTGVGRKSLNDDPDECQIVYQLYPVAADSEVKSLEGNVPQACPNPPRGVLTESQEDSSEEQVVFELESVTTSVVDMVKSEGELDRESQGSSPGIILEKFLTSRGSGSRESADISNQVVGASTNVSSNGTSTDHRTTTLPSRGTSGLLNIKEEDLSQPVMPPVLSPDGDGARGPLINRSLYNEQGVQMFVVKEEDPLILNEPHTVQQPSNGKRRDGHLSASNVAEADPPVECNMGERSVCRDELETVTSTVPRPTAKQCIFFPVKEEERELRLDPSPRAENLSNSGVEEHDDICEISTQHETPCVDSALAEEGDMGVEQHNTEDLVEFLLKRPETEDSGGIDSEPEAETLAMSCYHGSRSSGSANPPVRSSPEPDQRNDNQLSQNGVGSQNGQKKPIDYFTQYFDWKTWQDVANITAKTSKKSNPVTAKEVSQFVGIHIAMGTLKFPSTKLYWEDCTRVPLVADAMTASRFSEVLSKLRLAEEGDPTRLQGKDKVVSATSTIHQSTDHDSQVSETADDPHKAGKTCSTQSPLKTDPLSRVHVLMEKVQKTCQSLKREGNHGVSQYPLLLQRPPANPVHSLHHTVMLSTCGLVVDFNLCLDDSDREETVKKMVLSGQNSGEGMVFLCKPELSTPSMLEQLLEAGVQSAGKVGGARGQVGDEFVSSDGKLKLFRCHHGFILSAAVKGRSRSTSLVSGFERALKAAKLNRDLRKAYHTPCLSSSPTAWPLSVLWHLTDLALVNSWLQHRGDRSHEQEPLSLMAFRLEVSKALILSSSSDAQDATPPRPPAPERPEQGTIPGSASIIETPLPDIAIRYDGIGHWPEQVAEGEGARCRFGGCDRTSRVRCLKCCVFLCISRSHNCFLQFHSQGAL
ncbi:uncharacterized protein LOC105891837 isoform X3 [Clupea harengus]|uniref:Uncharacterized protein LOC105891837 isoform X3 n=1 Tax=Clupea harengus TaxID=7950 RepID=A0A6P8G6D2_CLUHA|nr:uncharacterized protein LOC105891837 isoform X3 [Clupea harengus]